MDMVAQPYPLFLAEVNDGVVDIGRIIGWAVPVGPLNARPIYAESDPSPAAAAPPP
jgi:hypothetical protein